MTTKYIEFIGPSGVGKSTLFKEVKNYMQNDWDYFEHVSVARLAKKDNEFYESLHWQLLVHKMKILKKMSINGFQKITLMKYSSDIIFFDFCMVNGIYEKGFFLEEGLSHNFAQELTELPISKFTTLMANRAIIYLVPRDSYSVVKRIRKREQEGGHVVTHHVGIDDSELCRIVSDSTIAFEKFTNRCRSANIPVCKVFAEDNISRNIDIVLSFEKQVCPKYLITKE